ncbi:MAG: Flp pilus assembly complex ATPase component TadA, partial [Acetobacteraceae bacterium]|nr:Flp pilus assembly complex ATPase component TadA [Acetobacteraceae bacterium]
MPIPSLEARIDELAEILVRTGQCDSRTLDRGRRVAAETGQRLDTVLLQLGLVSERGLAEAYATLLDRPIARQDRYPSGSPLLADRLASRFLRDARALPVAEEGDTLVIAAADPLDPFTPAAISAATGRRVAVEIAVPIELEAALDRLYPRQTEDRGEEHTGEEASDEPLKDDTERLKDLASEAPVIRMVNQLISRAVETRASDIHIEPFEDRLRIRYRYDGVLHDAETFPPSLTAALISRVKIMARLDIAERRLPQDGRINFPVRGTEIDLRVATLPSLHGENVVVRVLDRAAVEFDFKKLGIPPAVTAKFRAALELPNGMVLLTGPTGSGKTTTLYTGLLELNSVVRKIITLEDPIEYQLHGIVQTQARTQVGLTFANLLRALLRNDPNVVMVGEIRDLPTAQTAAQAALAGRLVLSTLHTNSAAAAVTRLRDMGLEDYLVTAVLRGVMGQRLVRRLCTTCRRGFTPPPELVRRFDLERRTDRRPVTLWHAAG